MIFLVVFNKLKEEYNHLEISLKCFNKSLLEV